MTTSLQFDQIRLPPECDTLRHGERPARAGVLGGSGSLAVPRARVGYQYVYWGSLGRRLWMAPLGVPA